MTKITTEVKEALKDPAKEIKEVGQELVSKADKKTLRKWGLAGATATIIRPTYHFIFESLWQYSPIKSYWVKKFVKIGVPIPIAIGLVVFKVPLGNVIGGGCLSTSIIESLITLYEVFTGQAPNLKAKAEDEVYDAATFKTSLKEGFFRFR